MLIKIMMWGPVLGLLLAAGSWQTGGSYALLLDLVVCAGAIVATKQAANAREYLWASGLFGMALLLNPIVPVFRPAGNLMLLLLLACLSPLGIALGAWMDARWMAAMRLNATCMDQTWTDATITLYPNLITDLHPRGEPIVLARELAWAQHAG
jgi:hypothetical protein